MVWGVGGSFWWSVEALRRCSMVEEGERRRGWESQNYTLPPLGRVNIGELGVIEYVFYSANQYKESARCQLEEQDQNFIRLQEIS
jgi:hypothetical protein